MPYERTEIGEAFRRDPERGRRMLRDAIDASSGNLRRAAAALAISRRHLYRLVYREDLEPFVARCRAGPEWLRRTREVIETFL